MILREPSVTIDPASCDRIRAALRDRPQFPDEQLADWIMELAPGGAVDLQPFFDAIPDLMHRPLVLDGAIEASVESMRARGLSEREALDILRRRHPDAATAIDMAEVLSRAMEGTTALASRVAHGSLTLPCWIGPPTSAGTRRYELRELIGQGSQGTVFLARDALLSEASRPTWVAVKRTSPSRAGGGTARSFEALRARRVNHPNVVRVLDLVEDDDLGEFIIYEYVRGSPLEAWRESRRDLDHNAVARLVAAACEGVQAAHAAGLVHRDIKPSNILMTEDGTPRITDFGIAAPIDAPPEQRRLGSLAFMAPEQYRMDHSACSPAADVYSLGGVFFWLLTGRAPNGDTPDEVAERLLGDRDRGPDPRAADPGIDPDLAAICSRAMSPVARDRHQSADSLAIDLHAWLEREPIRWLHSSPSRRVMLAIRRSPAITAASAAVLIVLLGAVITAIYSFGAARTARVEAALEVEQIARSDAEARVASANRVEQAFTNYIRERGKDSVAANWLNMVTFGEVVLGNRWFDDANASGDPRWERRIEVAQEILAEADAAGRGEQLDAAMFRSLLGLWTLNAGRSAEAIPILDHAFETWSRLLTPEDRWLDELNVIRHCARSRAAAEQDVAAAVRSAGAAAELLARIEPEQAVLTRLVAETERIVAAAVRSAAVASPE